MLSEEWHTFNTPDLHSDAAVFQFQLMHEHLEMFRRQRWLGERDPAYYYCYTRLHSWLGCWPGNQIS
jgi:hypothetical protein